MHLIPYYVAYAAIAVFFVAVIARSLMWARMPMHLRWELYPVAHEAKKAHYGGSYLEESEWWKKPREVSLMGELKVMIPEILFLVALKEHNRKLWLRSFPFHFGLYVVIACTVLMMAAGLLELWAPTFMGGPLGNLLGGLIWLTGVAGLCLAIIGALGLLGRRLNDPVLKIYTTSSDLFNLIIFVVGFGCALVTFLTVDRDFALVRTFVANLITFRMEALPGTGMATILASTTVVLLGLVLAYIPLTHMSHFVGKYFAYHAIRWNDAPNLRGGGEEKTIGGLLDQKISWAAPHIQGNGEKTWVDVATEDRTK